MTYRWLINKHKSICMNLAKKSTKKEKYTILWEIPFIGNLLSGLLKKKTHYIGGSDILPPPLSVQEEKILVLNIENEESRKTLIEHNLRLVVYIAKKFENTGINLEDLISIGSIGLIKSVNTFKADKNIKLATYASRCIENEILMYLRKTSSHKHEISIDEPLNTDYDGNELVLSDILGSESDQIQKIIDDEVDKELLYKAIAKLNEREREIMIMRFGLSGQNELTQKEVAVKLGISQSYISRLEKKIILRLKKDMDKMLKQ